MNIGPIEFKKENDRLTLKRKDTDLKVQDLEPLGHKMLEHNDLPKLIPVNFIKKNHEVNIEYDKKGYISLSEYLEKHTLEYSRFYEISLTIINVLKTAPNYLLDSEKFILAESEIYLGKLPADVKLIYIPINGYEGEEKVEISFKRLMFDLLKKVNDISNNNFLTLVDFLKDDNFTLENFRKLLLDVSQGINTMTNTFLGENENDTYQTVKELPPLSRKQKLYSSLIGVVLLAIIWSQIPTNTDFLLGVAFFLSIGVLALIYVYYKIWRPGVEKVEVNKKKKIKKKKITEPELDMSPIEIKVKKIKSEDFDTFYFNQKIEEKSIDIEFENQEKSVTNYETNSENTKESFVLSDKTTLLDDDSDEELKRNVKVNEVTQSYGSLLFNEDEFPLQNEIELIGREQLLNSIGKEFPTISTKHIEIKKDLEGTLVKDLGSINGTKLNGVNLKPLTFHTLNDGDELKLGDTDVIFKVDVM